MVGLLNRRKMLGERQEALLASERQTLQNLRKALGDFGVDVAPGDMRTIEDTIAHLEELFLLVIAGEFNSGKSSFINALLGDTVLREGVTPTTDRITLLRHGPEPAERLIEEFLLEIQFPADVLQRILVVDTPGTNAIVRRHEELTREFIPRADLVLFITSADRPFTESERTFLMAIQEWGKKIVFVLNKVDLLEPADLEQVMSFIRENARDLLGFSPEIFPVSARLAKRARAGTQGDPQAWEASRFEAVERYILETLDEGERVRLKLMTPIGVAQRITDKYLTVVEDRLGALQQDVGTLENIDRQMELFREDMNEDFRYHLTELDNVLNEFELRGQRFFDDTLRINNIWELRDSDRLRERFEFEVIGDLPKQVDARLHGMIDWIVEKNLRLWQSTMDYLQRNRVTERRHDLIGDIGGSFEYNRSALINSVAAEAQRVVQTYDRDYETEKLVDDVRSSLVAVGLVELGAVGVGGLIAAAGASLAVDFTGIAAAGIIAVGGLFLIPAKRRQLKSQFHDKVQTMREQLPQTMRRQFESESEQMIARIRESVAPYTRFVRSQRELLLQAQKEFSDVDVELGRIRAEIGA